MKTLRIILILLIITWMGTIFYFSHQLGDESQNTSSRVTRGLAKIIYDENAENFEEKVNALDPIIRKLAHYSIYLIRRNTNNIRNFYI